MRELVRVNRGKVIDLLSERLRFERTAGRLYDAILGQVSASRDGTVTPMRDQLQQICDQKEAHHRWLEEQLRSLGADVHLETELSKLVAQESEGIERIALTDRSLPHLFHAALAAELVDNAGWQLLLDLADRADDGDARERLRTRLHEEEGHLYFMRQAVERFARRDVLGESAPPPSIP